MIEGETTGGHDAVDVGMADQRLAPRVENAQHTDLRTEMTRGGRHLPKRGGARLKEPRVQTGPIPIGQGQERMRECEDDMHVGHVEQIAFSCIEPALARLRLTLRTVPITTRVIGDGLMPAGVTPIEVPS